MMALLAIPALIGAGLAYGHLSSLEDEAETEDDPIDDITLLDGIIAFEGGDLPEHVQANTEDNVITGGGAADKLSGLEGDDTLDGGDGNDRLFGGDGDDVLSGGAGNDRVFLGLGDDTALAEGGSDKGDDMIRGGAGDDRIIDQAGANAVYGDLGHDLIVATDETPGEAGADTLSGGYGNDTLLGDNGDLMTGGAGEDSFVVTATTDISGAPPMLLDFDLREDLFSVIFLEDPEVAPVVDFKHNPETDQLAAIVNGQQVALLNDIAASDIPFIQTFVTTLPELMATNA